MLFEHEGATKFVMTKPEIGVELESLADGFFPFRKDAPIKKDSAEADPGFRVFVIAELQSPAERGFGFSALAEGQLRHSQLGFGFIVFGREGESLLKIGDGGFCVLLLV